MRESAEHGKVLAGVKPGLNGNGARGKNPRSSLDDRGFPLGEELRRRELEVRLSVWRPVTVERQNKSRAYVVRGTESGGAVADLGHYVTFAAEDGSALEWLHPLDAIGANQTHAVVVAPSLMRVEVLRVHRTYELAITRHAIALETDKPKLVSSMVYRGAQGYLALELWEEKDKGFRGEVLPTFHTRSGEEHPVPAPFERAVRAAVHGACCVGCRESHYLKPPTLKREAV